ncbi:DUF3159 domain-containing protein [Streptomyces sp. TR06-5]|uniref:DUF3159 domain-containing protein n=1 Tax=Streptomyces sp. TR06-5 TaxID=3385976 RepID=UPI0039A269A5
MTSLDKQTAGNNPAGDAAEATEEVADRAGTQQALLEAFGGLRGFVETTLPGLVFILIYTINQDVHASAIAALVLSGVMCVARLVGRSTVKHAFSGVFGVVVGVAFAVFTGNAKDFYLPGMLYGLGLSLAYLISAATGFPLLGIILGPVFKENLSWRHRNPGRKRAYVRASYAWGLIFLGKSAILFPLYFFADPTRFGWVTIALKIPPLLLAVYLTWIFLAKAPPPINVIAEMEAEEAAKAEKAQAEAAENEDRTEAPAESADGTPAASPSRHGGRHRR